MEKMMQDKDHSSKGNKAHYMGEVDGMSAYFLVWDMNDDGPFKWEIENPEQYSKIIEEVKDDAK